MHFLCRIQFKTKKVWFVFKKVKKIIYFHFLVKIQADFLFSIANLWNFCHETSKITLPELFKIFEIRSHQRRTLDLYPARNNKLSGAICASKAQAQAPIRVNRVWQSQTDFFSGKIFTPQFFSWNHTRPMGERWGKWKNSTRGAPGGPGGP